MEFHEELYTRKSFNPLITYIRVITDRQTDDQKQNRSN